jgi:hypothetical protein
MPHFAEGHFFIVSKLKTTQMTDYFFWGVMTVIAIVC